MTRLIPTIPLTQYNVPHLYQGKWLRQIQSYRDDIDNESRDLRIT